MWYTAVIVVDIFLAWTITNAIVQAALGALLWAGVPRSWMLDMPYFALRFFGLPDGFVRLVALLPNAALVGLYFMFRLPRSERFCHWDGWRYMRERHFSITVSDLSASASSPSLPCDVDVLEKKKEKASWVPPHARPFLGGGGGGDGGATEKRRQVIYAVCPHGVYGEVVMFYMVLNKLYDGVVVVATSLLFWIPIVREFACLGGAVPATSATISSLLNHGRSIVMLPEGLRGVLHINDAIGGSGSDGKAASAKVLRGIDGECEPRKGFIRCALTSSRWRDIEIVPVYCHDANSLYDTFIVWPWFQRLMLSRYMYPWPVICFGWYGSFWPKARPVRVCFGRSISLVDAVTGAARAVDVVHEEYCAAIEELAKK